MEASATSIGVRESFDRPRTVRAAPALRNQDTRVVMVDVARPVGGPWVRLVAALVAVVLFLGWQGREESSISAEYGLGYALGIVGGSLMLLLLLYPMRKRVRAMRQWWSIRAWFEMHIWLGILGPILVLFHSNFQLGSTNANVALAAMILVTMSGLVGRYLYGRVHCGLHGRKGNLSHFLLGEKVMKVKLSPMLVHSPKLEARLEGFSEVARDAPKGLLQGTWRALVMSLRTRWTYMRACRDLETGLRLEARLRGWTGRERRKRGRVARRQLSSYLATVRQIAELGLYERLFSYWHVLHLPMFLLLLVTGVVHVVAVHMY